MSYQKLAEFNTWTKCTVRTDARREITVMVSSGFLSTKSRAAVLNPNDWHRLPEIIDALAAEMLDGGEVDECRWIPKCDGYGQPPRPETERVVDGRPTHTLAPAPEPLSGQRELFV